MSQLREHAALAMPQSMDLTGHVPAVQTALP